jgi:hypothetical protein
MATTRRRGFRALVPKWRRVCRRALNDFARETFTGRAEDSATGRAEDSASRHNRDGSSDFTHAGAVLRQLEIAKISEPRDSTPSSSAVNTSLVINLLWMTQPMADPTAPPALRG